MKKELEKTEALKLKTGLLKWLQSNNVSSAFKTSFLNYLKTALSVEDNLKKAIQITDAEKLKAFLIKELENQEDIFRKRERASDWNAACDCLDEILRGIR